MSILPINRLLFTAAILATLTAGIHILVGTPEIEPPLLQSAIPLDVRLLLLACWHLVSACLTISAIGFFIGARPANRVSSRQMVKLLSFLWIAFGLVFVAVALVYAGTPMLARLPQWIMLLPVGALGLWGSKQSPS